MRRLSKLVQARNKQLEAFSSTKRDNHGILQELETQYQEAMQGMEILNSDDFKEVLIRLREEKQKQLAQRLKTRINARFMPFHITEAIQNVAVRLDEIVSRERKEMGRVSVIGILKDMDSKPGKREKASRGEPIR